MADKNGTSEVDTTVKTGTIVKGGTSPTDRFKEYMQQRAELDGSTLAYDVAANQVDKIMSAEGTEIWDADNLDQIGGRDLVDIEMTIQSYTVHKSTRADIQTPWGVFIMVHATRLENGEELVFNTGAPLIMSKLRALEAAGMLPCDAVIKSFTAGNGDVLKLRPVPKRVVRS